MSNECRRRRKKKKSRKKSFTSLSFDVDSSTMPRAGGGTTLAASAAGLPLVPSFQVNELISIDKYLRSAGLLLRQASRKKKKGKREKEKAWNDGCESTRRRSLSTSSLPLSFSPASNQTNKPTGRRLPPRRR